MVLGRGLTVCFSRPRVSTPPPPPAVSKKGGWGQKGTTKKLCDKDFAERSGELSGAICLKALGLLGNDR